MRNYIDRFTTFDRVLHWLVAITFFLLVLSALGLYAHTFFGYFDFFGTPQQGIMVHKWSGIIFFVSSVLLFMRHAAETCRFDADDRIWIKEALAERLSFLSSEKLSRIMWRRFWPGVMGVTGLVIWEPTAFAREFTQVSLLLHCLFFTLFMMAAIVHIYLASVGNPGTLEGMLWGQVKKIWAKKHASKWYRDIPKNG